MTAGEITERGAPVESEPVPALSAERLAFFSDAVVAIALTLLALELPVPEGVTNREVWTFVGEHVNSYIAFLISFVVIGSHWGGHHRLFRWVREIGGRLTLWNFLWLFTIVVTPFATRVLTEDGAFETRFTFYAAVQGLSGLCFLLMLRELAVHDLLRPETPPTMLANATVRLSVLTAAFLVSIPVAFVTHAAYLCWMAMPLVSWVTRGVVARRRAAGRAAVSPGAG